MQLPNAVIVGTVAALLMLCAHVGVFVARRRARQAGEPESPMPALAAIGVGVLALAAVIARLMESATLADVLFLLGVAAGLMAALVPLLPGIRPPAAPPRVRAGARITTRRSATAQGRAAAQAIARVGARRAVAPPRPVRKGKPVLPPTPYPEGDPATPVRPADAPVANPVTGLVVPAGASGTFVAGTLADSPATPHAPAADDAPTEFLPRIVLGDPTTGPLALPTGPPDALGQRRPEEAEAVGAGGSSRPQPVQEASHTLQEVDRIVDDIADALRLGPWEPDRPHR